MFENTSATPSIRTPRSLHWIDAEVGNSFLVYEVTIVDRDGTALISSDASLPGRKVLPRPPLSQLVGAGFHPTASIDLRSALAGLSDYRFRPVQTRPSRAPGAVW